MIVPMKKVTLAVLASWTSETLERLRELGVVHVRPVRTPESGDTRELEEKRSRIEKALEVLEPGEDEEAPEPSQSGLDIADTVNRLVEQRDRYREELDADRTELDRLAPLGDFDPSDVAFLGDRGLKTGIYRCREGDLERTEIQVPHQVVGVEGDSVYLMAFSRSELDLPFEAVALPELEPSELRRQAASLEEKLKGIEEQLDQCRVHVPTLRNARNGLEEQLEFARVKAGMGSEGRIAYLQGYCPEEDLGRLRESAEKHHWGLMIEEPEEEQGVPTLLRNPRWVRIIEPVYRFMGTVPGYTEFDFSFWFLASMCLFFAMLVSDGGYGLLFLVVTYLVRRRYRGLPREPFVLFYVFSMSTVIWGSITGTWFGVEELARIPILKWPMIPALNSYADNQNFMIRLCFLLGAGHLTVAHGLKGLRYMHSIRALGEAGWILILWGLYFLAGELVLGDPLPEWTGYMLVAGLLLAGAFSGKPGGGLLKTVLTGIANLPLSVIRSFSDLVSYLRLYAVGYATVVIAVSFNDMAASLGEGPWFQLAGVPVILLLGHSMNILMAIMAVLVHGIRLNILEFSSHLEMNWSGKTYRPFRRQSSAPGR